MKPISVAVFCILLSSSAGCAPTLIKAYDGPELRSDEIAIVKVRDSLLIYQIDGNKELNCGLDAMTTAYLNCQISLFPGRHTVDLCYSDARHRCFKPIPFSFDVYAGRIYRVEVDIKGNAWKPWKGLTWRPYIEDVTTQEPTTTEQPQRKRSSNP